MVNIIFYDSSFSNFWIKFKLFKFLESLYIQSVWIFMSLKLFHYLRPETRMPVSLLIL